MKTKYLVVTYHNAYETSVDEFPKRKDALQAYGKSSGQTVFLARVLTQSGRPEQHSYRGYKDGSACSVCGHPRNAELHTGS